MPHTSFSRAGSCLDNFNDSAPARLPASQAHTATRRFHDAPLIVESTVHGDSGDGIHGSAA